MTVEQKFRLERAEKPEDVGVSSKALKELIDDFKESGVEVHSLMFIRHGKVAFETWAYPFTPEMPHIMYSVSKSFTSTAIGFAIDEGLLTLDTKLVDIFPEYAKNNKDEKLNKITVYNLLTMTAGKNPSILTDRTKNQWVKDFFNAPWSFAPGEGWQYISENQYMLSAIIHKLTGNNMREFLRPRLFEPLGIDFPFWETDGNGIEAGGWGLYITTEELANVTQCYLDGGMWNGKQVIPKEWVEFATSKLERNDENNNDADTICGYGACFWQNSIENSYRLDGMFSQFGIVLKDYDACVIITACEIDEQKTRYVLWRHFPDGFFDGECPYDVIEKPSLAPLPELPPSKIHSSFESVLEYKKVHIKEFMPLEIANFPLSMLPIFPVFMSTDKAGYCNDFEFDFNENECTVTWQESGKTNSIVCGLDGKVRFSPMSLGGVDYTASATACWANDNNLFIWVRPLGAAGQRRFRFRFCEDGEVILYSQSYQDLNDVADNLSIMYVELAKTIPGKRVIQNSFKSVLPIFLEPKHNGKLIDKE